MDKGSRAPLTDFCNPTTIYEHKLRIVKPRTPRLESPPNEALLRAATPFVE